MPLQSFFSSPSRLRSTRQGFPTASTFAGRSRVTTLPAPTTVLSPRLTPGMLRAPAPIQQLRPMRTGALLCRPFRRSSGSRGCLAGGYRYQRLPHSVRVRCRYFMPTVPASECCVSYEVFGDGTVETTLSFPAVEGLPDMPEFGMLFKLSADYDRFRFYGLGPEENYADRQRGARLGIYETTAAENLSRYLVPQECGNRCGVRWARVLDRRGRGMEFSGDELSVCVLPWTPHELENAAHPHELPPVHYTVVRVALQQMGVGGDDSWGARTHPEYLLPRGQDLCLRFRFRGV